MSSPRSLLACAGSKGSPEQGAGCSLGHSGPPMSQQVCLRHTCSRASMASALAGRSQQPGRLCSPGSQAGPAPASRRPPGSTSSLPEPDPTPAGRAGWLMAPLMFSKPGKDLPRPEELRQQGMSTWGRASLGGACGACGGAGDPAQQRVPGRAWSPCGTRVWPRGSRCWGSRLRWGSGSGLGADPLQVPAWTPRPLITMQR